MSNTDVPARPGSRDRRGGPLWVLSLPFDLRARAAFDAKILSAVVRSFARALAERHRAWARGLGLDVAETGAITFVRGLEAA